MRRLTARHKASARFFVLAALGLGVAISGCADRNTTSAPMPTPTTAPNFRWERLADSSLPKALRTLSYAKAAASSSGFAVIGSDIRDQNGKTVFTSRDGRVWQNNQPSGMLRDAQFPITGFGDAMYLLGATRAGATVWRMAQDHQWQAITLAGSQPGEGLVSVAAGPRGVIVVGLEHPMAGLDSDIPVLERVTQTAFRIWVSTDGTSFSGPHRLDVGGLLGSTGPQASSNSDGFMLVGGSAQGRSAPIAYRSVDGTKWEDIAQGLEDVDVVAPGVSNAAASVLCGYNSPPGYEGETPTITPAKPSGLWLWARSAGQPKWQRVPRIDPGRLPDKGVAPFDNSSCFQAMAIGSGFMVIGNMGMAGAVWSSADGREWTKTPVAVNGFDGSILYGLGVSAGKAILSGDNGTTRLWLGSADS